MSTDVLCLVLAIIIPSFVQIGICYYTNNRQNIHKTICVYLCGIGLTAMLTNCIKLYVGYLRPIFMDQCQPDDTYEDCTSDNEREMRLSFPSGHASVSFCGLCLFSYFLEHQFGISASRILIYDKPSGQLVMAHQSVKYKRIVSILCYSPIFLACFIAASRVVDNYHFPADVVGGTVLGGSVSLLVHGIWYERHSFTIQ
jgi:membrane-associated phospholipid phosphatase